MVVESVKRVYKCRGCGASLMGTAGWCVACFKDRQRLCSECHDGLKLKSEYRARDSKTGQRVVCPVCHNERILLVPYEGDATSPSYEVVVPPAVLCTCCRRPETTTDPCDVCSPLLDTDLGILFVGKTDQYLLGVLTRAGVRTIAEVLELNACQPPKGVHADDVGPIVCDARAWLHRQYMLRFYPEKLTREPQPSLGEERTARRRKRKYKQPTTSADGNTTGVSNVSPQAATPTWTRETHLAALLPPAILDDALPALQAAGLVTVGGLLDRAAAVDRLVRDGVAHREGAQLVYQALREVKGLPGQAVLAIGDAVVESGLLDGNKPKGKKERKKPEPAATTPASSPPSSDGPPDGATLLSDLGVAEAAVRDSYVVASLSGQKGDAPAKATPFAGPMGWPWVCVSMTELDGWRTYDVLPLLTVQEFTSAYPGIEPRLRLGSKVDDERERVIQWYMGVRLKVGRKEYVMGHGGDRRTLAVKREG